MSDCPECQSDNYCPSCASCGDCLDEYTSYLDDKMNILKTNQFSLICELQVALALLEDRPPNKVKEDFIKQTRNLISKVESKL